MAREQMSICRFLNGDGRVRTRSREQRGSVPSKTELAPAYTTRPLSSRKTELASAGPLVPAAFYHESSCSVTREGGAGARSPLVGPARAMGIESHMSRRQVVVCPTIQAAVSNKVQCIL